MYIIEVVWMSERFEKIAILLGTLYKSTYSYKTSNRYTIKIQQKHVVVSTACIARNVRGT